MTMTGSACALAIPPACQSDRTKNPSDDFYKFSTGHLTGETVSIQMVSSDATAYTRGRSGAWRSLVARLHGVQEPARIGQRPNHPGKGPTVAPTWSVPHLIGSARVGGLIGGVVICQAL